MFRSSLLLSGAVLSLMASGAAIAADPASPATKVTVDSSGTVHADGLVIPPSDYLSPEARQRQVERMTVVQPNLTGGIAGARTGIDGVMKPIAAHWLSLYPSRIERVAMNDVVTQVIEPQGGVAPDNAHRVLISLHGGGFFAGSGNAALAEAIPLSGEGKVKVVSVDYRLAPENRFPAASEDVEKVYRKLLESYKPGNIGIYGCSAGGTLTAQSVAWFQSKGLPRPGAVGIFCAGAMPGYWFGGDASVTGAILNGMAPVTPEQIASNPGNLYLAGVDRADPLVTPGLYPEVLAKFPPTLILTGTRDNSLSNALVTNVRLLEAGVETQLLVLEGIGHSEFNNLPGTPEATEAFRLTWRFFDRHLGR